MQASMRWEQAAVQKEGPVQRGADIDKIKKAKEIVRALVGSMTKEGDIVVACDSKSKQWKAVNLRRAMQNWSMKCADTARNQGSVMLVFSSSERLANRMKINAIGEVVRLVKRTGMDAPKVGKLVKTSEMGDPKVGNMGMVGKLVRLVETGGPQAGMLMKEVETGGLKV